MAAAPAQQPQSALVAELKTEIAIIRTDLEHMQEYSDEFREAIKAELVQIRSDIKDIKGYFLKATMAAAGTVAVYFLQWILTGGLSHVVAAVR